MAGSSTKVVVSAIIGNSFITVIKFIGWFVSMSPSMLAEAIHSLADTLNQLLLLVGIKQSTKAPSREHPSGTGEMQYVWNLISAVVIFFIGFGVTLYHGIHALVAPHESAGDHSINWIVIGVLLVSLLIEGYIFLQALKEVNLLRGDKKLSTYLKESDDPTIVAVLIEDGIAVLGVSLAMVGIILGNIFESNIFDVVTAIVIAFLLGFMAVAMAFINGKLLIGKSVTIHKESEYQKFIEDFPEVMRVKKLSSQVIGAGKVRLSFEVEIHGERVIDYEALKVDAKKIQNGEDTFKVLISSSERMIRLNSKFINSAEVAIQEKFPEVNIIDFEVC